MVLSTTTTPPLLHPQAHVEHGCYTEALTIAKSFFADSPLACLDSDPTPGGTPPIATPTATAVQKIYAQWATQVSAHPTAHILRHLLHHPLPELPCHPRGTPTLGVANTETAG